MESIDRRTMILLGAIGLTVAACGTGERAPARSVLGANERLERFRSQRASLKIDVVIYDGFDEMDAFGPMEVFRSAQHFGADLQSRLVTRTPQPYVTGAFGLRFIPDATYAPGANLLMVTGGSWAARADVGAWGEVQRGQWLPLLRQASGDGVVMAGVCTGTMLLAHAGIVGKRRANTHHTAWEDLAATGATLVKDRVVDDGNLVTSGGVTSGIDLALWLVESYAGIELADRVAKRMEYERTRPNVRSRTIL